MPDPAPKQTVALVPGMDLFLWIWDSGALEGFAIYVDKLKVSEHHVPLAKSKIQTPTATVTVEVKFAGADGGSTKITNGDALVVFQNGGIVHSYEIQVPNGP